MRTSHINSFALYQEWIYSIVHSTGNRCSDPGIGRGNLKLPPLRIGAEPSAPILLARLSTITGEPSTTDVDTYHGRIPEKYTNPLR